ncbi:MAG: SusD/RagB family nutrient-binding outer membrane lipoprotein [Chitinophagaceae bacterium]
MKNLKTIVLIVMGIMIMPGCKKFDRMLTDPSSSLPETADVDLYLNYVQIAFTEFYGSTDVEPGLSENGEELTRMEYMAARTYKDSYQPEFFDGLWRDAYQKIFNNVNAMIPLAQKSGRHLHIGMGKVLKAYTAATLVDFFGDVPYSEASLGTENTNPKADPGKQVYDSAFALLDQAIASFNLVIAGTPLPTNDLFYGGGAVAKATSWRRAAKTLKLKLYNQIRLVDNTVQAKINALVAEGELITTDAQAFVFKYGSKALNPVSRHQKYSNYYTGTGANDYIGNHFMYVVYAEKGLGLDPRWRYYFYRQIGNITLVPVTTLECLTSPNPPHYPAGVPFCYADVAGFYGRDHGNDRGIPPDGFQRTVWGIYPAGGRFDNDDKTRIRGADDGALGQGILPVWQPAFTEFVKAEAAITIGTTGDARALLESGVRKSIATVVAYPATVGVTVPAARVPTVAGIQAYVDKVLQLYDAAATNADKLNVIMKEYYIALWGNGIESYNNYRRTGMPRNMQPNLNASPGPFLRSMFYPGSYANRNNNVTQKTTTNVKVFWDNNPDNIYVN